MKASRLMTFERVSEFLDFIERLGYGEIPYVSINFSQDEAGLENLLASSKTPLSRFAAYLDSQGGLAFFDALKIQDGLPVFGATPFQHNGRRAIQNRKFN